MSGIYIPSMGMPTKCDDCEVLSDDLVCPFTGLRGYNGKPEICPLVEVPDHGRLIDADALCDGLVSNHPVVIYAKSATTIIPADRGVENG